MKPAPFDYHVASSLAEALALLEAPPSDEEVRVIAGGQSLIPMLNLRLARPTKLIDITRITELQRIEIDSSGNLNVGAAVTQSALLNSVDVQTRWPILTAALSNIGHQQIRNRGTVCGSLAHNDPASELPATALALDTTFTIRSASGSRTVEAAEMFRGPFSTAIEPDEILVEATFPDQASAGWSFLETAQRTGDFATVGVATIFGIDADQVDWARIALCGVGSGPVRAHEAETALIGNSVTADLAVQAARLAATEISPTADVHASAEYRSEIAEYLVEQSIIEAWERS